MDCNACDQASMQPTLILQFFILKVFQHRCFILTNIVILKQDENRYNASRGAHLNLKRAEKARILVNKIPGMCRIRG